MHVHKCLFSVSHNKIPHVGTTRIHLGEETGNPMVGMVAPNITLLRRDNEALSKWSEDISSFALGKLAITTIDFVCFGVLVPSWLIVDTRKGVIIRVYIPSPGTGLQSQRPIVPRYCMHLVVLD